MMRLKSISTDLWGHLEVAALYAVRQFLQAVDERPLDKQRLRKLAHEAHDALYRVERAHKLPLPEPGSTEHP